MLPGNRLLGITIDPDIRGNWFRLTQKYIALIEVTLRKHIVVSHLHFTGFHHNHARPAMPFLAHECWIQISLDHTVKQNLSLLVGDLVFDPIQCSSEIGDAGGSRNFCVDQKLPRLVDQEYYIAGFYFTFD